MQKILRFQPKPGSGKSFKRFVLSLFSLLALIPLHAAVFPVTNTNDAGAGSFRQAILDVNAASAGPHTIQFSVYGQITLLTSLPQISKNDVTIDGESKIILNSNGTNPIINPFTIGANNITIRNFRLTNNGDVNIWVRANTTGVTVENISSSSNTGNLLNSMVYVEGASTNLTLRNIVSTDVEPCSGAASPFIGRGFYFANGVQTNLVMDNIQLRTQGNTRGCEGIVFRNAAVNGWTFTNSKVSGFQNAIVLDHTTGPVETANNVILNKVTVDSLYTGVSMGFYCDFVTTNLQIKNTSIDLDTKGTDDDGDYAIRFDNTTDQVSIDSINLNEVDLRYIWFNGAASNITINHATLESRIPGIYAGGHIFFESTVNTLTIKNSVLNGDKQGTTDDSDHGIVLIGHTQNALFDSLTFREFDVDAMYVNCPNTNFQLQHSRFIRNFDGIEFYGNFARSNVDITDCFFDGSERSAIVLNAANATTDVDLTDDTVINSTSHGVWLHGGATTTDISITGSVIRNNTGSGIYNNTPNKVVVTNNSIYNNGALGLDHSPGNCNYEGANRPVLVSSNALGGGQYQLTITVPNIQAGALYNIDVYANDPATSVSGGQYYVTTLTGVSAGTAAHTINYNTGPGATGTGFWTATLRIPLNNCGTSEFSDKLNIGVKAPACITGGILGWYRADMGINGLTWGDISGNANHLTATGDPDTSSGFVNFNPAVYYDGNDVHQMAAAATAGGAYTIIGLGKLEGSLNGRVFTSSTGNKLLGWFGGYEDRLYVEAWLNPPATAISNLTKLYSFKRGNTGSGPYEFKGNGVLINSGAASNGSAWPLSIGGLPTSEFSKVFVPEVFMFNRDLTPGEVQRVESYMALKYGITLNNGVTDYVASDGTTLIRTAATNTGYNKHITGIGKDDCTMLHQKQSLSADTGIVTIALGTTIQISNQANTNAVTTDKTFLVFGDNNGSLKLATPVTGTNVNQRMGRVWKVQKSAAWADQSITLQINGTGSNNYLLISTDPTFASISQELQLSASGSITLNSSQLATGIYFTVASTIKGPGNVNAGVALWLRADDGSANGTTWNDFSGNGNGSTQLETARQPAVLSAGINFNPALKFDGNDILRSPSLFTGTGVDNAHIYAVTITDALANQSPFGEFVSNGQYIHAHVPWTDGLLYWDAPFNYRAQGAWGGTLGAPYLWTFLRSPATMSASRNRIAVASFTAAMGNIPGANNPFTVGGLQGGSPFGGKIAELIVYNNSAATTNTQRQQIESYLALKYGLTFSPLAPVDYLASDGTTKFWDVTVNTGYNSHITGIGRDNTSSLLQKQSVSADTGYVTMALGTSIAATNAANSGTIATDKSFFVTGDNGGLKMYSINVTGITGVNVALARTWKVQKTNWTDQNITLRTDTSLTIPGFLLISTDATFGAGDLALPLTNGVITLNTSQLPNGAFFTFANVLKGPGGVVTGIGAWYRGDYGLSPVQWNDYSGRGINIPAPGPVAHNPGITANGMNFNPTATFIPPQYFGKGNAVDPATSVLGNGNMNNIAVFGVANTNPGFNGALFDQMTTNGYPVIAASHNAGNAQWDAPWGWRQTAPWGGSISTANVWSFTKSLNNMAFYRDRTTLVTDNVARDYGAGNGANYSSNLGVYHGVGYFQGSIPEIIIYKDITNTGMPALDRLKIESYLALKYGVTLNLASVAGYVATDGSVYWDAAINASYSKHITGIGRDDLTDLYQKQSLSVDTGMVTIALGNTVASSNALNANTIAVDKSFFVIGDNGASSAYLIPVAGFPGITNRMARIFKVDRTVNWTNQDITFKLRGGNAQTYLIVSADAVFNGSDTRYVLNADSTVTLNTSNLADGAFFTFAKDIKGPNGVNNGINFWLRADDGNATGGSWKDYAGYGHEALQAVIGSQPITDAKAINFNYGLRLDGTDDFLDINTTRVHPDNASIFVAASGTGFAAARELVGSGVVGGAVGMEFRMVGASTLQYLENNAAIAAVNGTATWLENRPYLWSVTQNNTTNGVKLYQNFKLDNQGTITLSPPMINLTSIGSRTTAARGVFWQGNISEVIVYDRVLPDTERQLVESYLGLKYGITLNNGATAYLASDNTPYWNVDATYKNRVTGIGRDDSTALNTKQSLSVDTGFVTLALGAGVPLTNELNTGTITNNRSFFVFADNGLSASNFTVSVTGSTNNVVRRMARIWKVQKTNWVNQDITLKIKPIGIDNYLLISNDPTFATFTQELPVAADGTITLSSALFTASDLYFTFGAPLKSPGGVPGHAMWVRADIGTSTSTNNTALQEWSDFSAFNNNVTQATPASQPTFLNNQVSNVNFNPVVSFDGVNSSMTAASMLKTATYDAAATFVLLNQATATNSIVWTEATGLGTQLTLHATWGDNVVYWDPPYISNRLSYNAGIVNNQSILWSATSNINLPANRQSIFKNGMNVANGNNTSQFTGNNSVFQLGRNVAGAISYNGRIGEVIIYTTALTPVQQTQVNSYMALKFGITLNNGDTNYRATDASIIWNATANSGYKKNIAGIGRDDEESLQQKQSRSINTGFQVTIGLGRIDSTNAANPNAFTADRSYLIWGDDSTATAFVTAVTGHPTNNYRMTRVWKVQETGTVGNVVVAIPQNVISASFSSPHLIVSSDATFDGGDTYIPLTATTLNGANYYTASVDLTNAQYFTFSALVAAPGGVLGEALWVRADAGVQSNASNQVEQWIDQSGNGAIVSELRSALPTHADAIAPSADIMQVLNGINFNPSVDFSGALNKSLKGNANVDWNSTASTVFGVSVLESTLVGGFGGIFSGLADWTANDGGSAGMGYVATATGYALDGAGCSPATSTSPTTGVPRAVRGTYTIPGNGLNSVLAVNGRIEAAAGVDCLNYATTFFEVGGRTAGTAGFDNRVFNGKIPEVIVYRSALSPADNNKVESYLAVKYGLTLDQTSPVNYVASDATVTWSAATNGIYKNNIAGIGRDDFSALLQKQSRSVNPGVQLAIGLGTLDSTNAANANTFTTNKSFLLWSDDNAAVTFKTAVAGNPNVNYRMSRLWTVQETGTVAQVEVTVPYDALPNPTQTYLVVSSDATIDATDTYIPLYDITLNGKRHWAAKTDFTTGQFFTYAAFIKSPGGVGVTSLWVRADKGIQTPTDATPVDMWVDFGNEVNNANQSNPALQPVYHNNATANFNYNPVVTFNGTNNEMILDITKLPVGSAPRTLIGVGSLNNISGNAYILGYGTAVANQGSGLLSFAGAGMMTGYTNELVTAAGFWQLNTPNELFGTFAGAGGEAALYSKMAAVATPENKAWVTGNTAARLGSASWSTAQNWSGPISEVIVFDRVLNNTERQRVTTYLAIRNGYTIDQATPYSSYLNTNSTVIWDATANVAYNKNIAGIGRDDIEGLSQKQSKSINAGAIVAIGLGSIATDNLANSNTFTADTTYLLWGSNSNALTTQATDLPEGLCYAQRLTQEWKTSISYFNNSLQPVSMEFDLTGVTMSGTTATDFTLLIDTDGDGNFTTGTVQQVAAAAFAANKVTFNNVAGLTHGAVFTLVTSGAARTATLTPYNTATAAIDECYNNGWILFKDPADVTKYVAGIYDPAGLIDITKITATVNVNSALSALGTGDATGAMRLKRRMLEINCNNCFDAVANPNPQFTVRLFYADTEISGAQSGEANSLADIKTANALTGPDLFKWFKATGTVADVLANLKPTTIDLQGGQWNDGSLPKGTVDGVQYVDFPGVNYFSTFGGFWTSGANIALPVNFISFDLRKKNDAVQLNWRVGSEVNVKGYYVERSMDGTTWSTLGFVEVKQPSLFNDYTFTDQQPLPGLNQYRIREEDKDGRTMYSVIRTIKWTNLAFDVTMFPVPVQGVLTLQMETTLNETVQLQVTDIVGRILLQRKIQLRTGTNREEVYMTSYLPGTYFIQITGTDKKWSGKVIKK